MWKKKDVGAIEGEREREGQRLAQWLFNDKANCQLLFFLSIWRWAEQWRKVHKVHSRQPFMKKRIAEGDQLLC